MKKITKRLREEAAVLCAIAASNGIGISTAVDYYGSLENSRQLALDAQSAVFAPWIFSQWKLKPGFSYGDTYAEAEALLRTGFVPEGWEDDNG